MGTPRLLLSIITALVCLQNASRAEYNVPNVDQWTLGGFGLGKVAEANLGVIGALHFGPVGFHYGGSEYDLPGRLQAELHQVAILFHGLHNIEAGRRPSIFTWLLGVGPTWNKLSLTEVGGIGQEDKNLGSATKWGFAASATALIRLANHDDKVAWYVFSTALMNSAVSGTTSVALGIAVATRGD